MFQVGFGLTPVASGMFLLIYMSANLLMKVFRWCSVAFLVRFRSSPTPACRPMPARRSPGREGYGEREIRGSPT